MAWRCSAAEVTNEAVAPNARPRRLGAPSSPRRRRRRPQSPWRASSYDPDRELWPGITKRDLVAYWQAVFSVALPGIAKRPLSILRCPDGINGKEQFFQKNGHGILPRVIRESSASKQPYLAIDDIAGLVAMAQMSAIELHAWGADEANPTCPAGWYSTLILARAWPGAMWSKRLTKPANA